jgi:hypothetical protein
VIAADNDLTTTWKTFQYCFDRDLYPQSVPSNMTTAQRETVGNSILKVQFSFNTGNDYSLTTYPPNAMYPAIPKNARFDFWLDQLEFFTEPCATTGTFQSTAGTAKPFPQNAALGTCAIATNAANYNAAISKAYVIWKSRFVQGDHIVAPEQMGGVTTSEAMGYGLMIAAAMGDKATFDSFSTDFCGGVLAALVVEGGIRFGLGSTLALRRQDLGVLRPRRRRRRPTTGRWQST